MPSYLGQNFLKDKKIISYILDKIKVFSNNYSVIVEIGPGEGVISKYLKDYFERIILFEKDEKLLTKRNWFDEKKYKLYLGDFLEQDLEIIFKKENINEAFIFGNLPYYITSPIFRKIVKYYKYFPLGFFMIQKEVADKIVTHAKKKSYLWRIVNYFYKVKYLKTVPPNAFRPAPKVKSALVLFERRNQLPQLSFEKMITWLDIVSPFKRKTLLKIYKIKDIDIAILPEQYHKKRLEDLDFEDIIRIINNIDNI